MPFLGCYTAGCGIIIASHLMSLSEPPYYLNGSEPPIIGLTCSGFCLIQHQVDGVLSDPANSAYFKFNERWVHLCFEASTIFWRDAEKPREPAGLTHQKRSNVEVWKKRN
jgi:hypothetical protein